MIYEIQNQMLSQLQRIQKTLQDVSFRLTGNNADAEDLYQETVLKIITHADKFKVGTNFKAWAVTIMRHIFINNYRKRNRRRLLLEYAPNFSYLNAMQASEENPGEHNITMQEIIRLVKKLPDDLRVPFLIMYQGYQYNEIAEYLETPLGTIKSRIFFARKRLQKEYLMLNHIPSNQNDKSPLNQAS
ncbi:MAG: RNA polymerase sigma factor [Crocinitomicaceae bacterium]|nr:RNA polymerase sigma factor [Crocinitomicaceae bacterium]